MTTMDGQLIDGGGSCGEKGEEGERPRFWCGGWRVSALPSPTLHGNTYLQYLSFTKQLGSNTMHLIQCEYLKFCPHPTNLFGSHCYNYDVPGRMNALPQSAS